MNAASLPAFLGIVGWLYGAVWTWLLMAVDAVRHRRLLGMGLLSVGLAGALAVALGFSWEIWGRISLAAGVALTASALYFALWPYQEHDWKRAKQRREDARQIGYHLVLLTGALIFATPFMWLVMTSLKPEKQIFAEPLALPHPLMWSNYPKTLEFLEQALPVGTWYGLRFVANTLYVTGLSLTGILFSSSLVAFSFARLRWPGRDLLFGILLATMMLPHAVTMIPTFLIYKSLGWIDTLTPLWFGGLFGGAFNIFLLRQFFLTIPNDLEDAAKIDGCGFFGIYARIMLPLIKPALAAVAIMHFVASWNDFMGPLIYISSPAKMTGSYALQLFRSAHTAEWSFLMAAATLWTIPILLLFFCTQRYFIQGITLTGMGGR